METVFSIVVNCVGWLVGTAIFPQRIARGTFPPGGFHVHARAGKSPMLGGAPVVRDTSVHNSATPPLGVNHSPPHCQMCAADTSLSREFN